MSASKKLGGGVLNELSHELNYAIKLFGPIEHIFAKLNYSKEKKIDVETEAKLFCITKKKINLSIFINFLSKNENRYCEIIGTKANLLMDFKNKTLLLNNRKLDKKIEKKDQMYDDQLRFFLSPNNNKEIIKKFDIAYETNKFIELVRASAKKNEMIKVL